MEQSSKRLMYHMKKKTLIEHFMELLLDLKYCCGVSMILGYSIYALTKNPLIMVRDTVIFMIMAVISYVFRNGVKNRVILLLLQAAMVISCLFWCKDANENILCILFLAGWGIYSLSVRIRENRERIFENNGLVLVLAGIPLEGLAAYYEYKPIKGFIFWIGFLLIVLHFVIKYLDGFKKYFEQAGQINRNSREIALKSHLLLAGYGIIGMGVMLIMSRLPLQGVWKRIRHGIYLLLRRFFHMLEGEPVHTRWDPSPTPIPTKEPFIPEGTIEKEFYLDLSWIGDVVAVLDEMLKIVIPVLALLCFLKIIYDVFQKMNKKEKGIEEEREFIHLSEQKKRRKKASVIKREERQAGNNSAKVRRLFYHLMIEKGIERYGNRQYMTSHEMCHLSGEDLQDIERIYQKARYSREEIRSEEVEQMEHIRKKGKHLLTPKSKL